MSVNRSSQKSTPTPGKPKAKSEAVRFIPRGRSILRVAAACLRDLHIRSLNRPSPGSDAAISPATEFAAFARLARGSEFL